MGTVEIIGALKAKFEAKLIEAQADVAIADELSVAVETEVKAANEAGFEEGLAQANQAGGSDKLYSDAEMNQIIADTKAPFEAKIAELEVEIAGLKAGIDAVPAQIEFAKAEAIAAFKADLAVKYAEQQVVESSTETGFAELLK